MTKGNAELIKLARLLAIHEDSSDPNAVFMVNASSLAHVKSTLALVADALEAAEATVDAERKYGARVAGQRDSALAAIMYGPIVAPPWLEQYANPRRSEVGAWTKDTP